ncbi:DinB family protein [Granulicella tundricola]|uniref:DinB family protein n=1 Tax=Granulicella tundricola (strain ATCC BAA-1859 / DSM 23138 / MP5ACTX9) TaxID=1198114 RepID=E8X592_GRATM|nr:DinB family protein [Granulicella tundricola]ADW68356.1 DinB family protein [Granulicella tundricola MP5ACTX9]
MTLAERLLPELEAELAKTRKVLEAVPDGHNDFKPHEKSMLLNRLAGHTAEFAQNIALILTLPGIDMATPQDPRKILRMETSDALLAEFDGLVPKAIEALKQTTDEAFDETFTLTRQGAPVFSNTRYTAYRNNALNHMIHHRAQLGVYLRLLEQPVPATFGPTADSK